MTVHFFIPLFWSEKLSLIIIMSVISFINNKYETTKLHYPGNENISKLCQIVYYTITKKLDMYVLYHNFKTT